MRASHLVLSLLGAGVLGCGGGNSSAPDASVDAFACAQSGTVNATAPLDFSPGGQAQGIVPTGETQLRVSALIFTDAAQSMGLLIVQSNNKGVFSAAAGKAGRFETPPAPGSYPLDTDTDMNMNPNFGFLVDFVNGISRGAGGTTINPTQVALLDPAAGGTVRIDSWTPAATPGGTTTIGATFTNAKFKGFNVNGTSLNPAGNGCDITIQNLQFSGLSVKWQTAAFPAAVSSGPPADLAPRQPRFGTQTIDVDGAAVLSADFRFE